MTQRRYETLLREAAQAVATLSGCQFRLGDIALEIEPIQPVGGSHDAQVYDTLGRFADEIGVEFSTLLTYRTVASRWPKSKRRRAVSFSVHRELAHLDNRFEVIKEPPWYEPGGEYRWTYDGAARAAGRTATHPRTTQEKVSRIHDLAKDDDVATVITSDLLRRPEVRHRVMSEPTTRHLVNRAQFERAEQIRETVRERTPVLRRLERTIDMADLLGACAAYVAAVNRIVPTLQDAAVSEEQRHVLGEALQRVHAAADWVKTVLDTGDTTMDEQLAALLRGDGS